VYTSKQRLFKLETYRALSDQKRKFALAVLVDGIPASTACRMLNLNYKRVTEDLAVQKCLADYRSQEPTGPTTPARNPRLAGKNFLSPVHEVASAIHGHRELLPSDEAVYAAEEILGKPRSVSRSGLNMVKVAEFLSAWEESNRAVATLKTTYESKKAASEGRALAATTCSACIAPIAEGVTRTKLPADTLCSLCSAAWQKSGRIPAGNAV
jgi:hypothetical protein